MSLNLKEIQAPIAHEMMEFEKKQCRVHLLVTVVERKNINNLDL